MFITTNYEPTMITLHYCRQEFCRVFLHLAKSLKTLGKGFAECFSARHSTKFARQHNSWQRDFAECFFRALSKIIIYFAKCFCYRHSAKIILKKIKKYFTECFCSRHSAKIIFLKNKRHTFLVLFIKELSKDYFFKNKKYALPSVFPKTLGKDHFEIFFENFAECLCARHSTEYFKKIEKLFWVLMLKALGTDYFKKTQKILPSV